MEILAIVLLLAGVFFTVVGIVIEDLDVLICAGILYFCCATIITNLNKNKKDTQNEM